MASVHDFLTVAISHHGHPYSVINRFGPKNYDCSGHVWAALRDIGLGGFPQSSSTMYRACQNISFEQAVATPGALVFEPENPLAGVGPLGHVAISLGNGYTSEARGRAYGVGSWPIRGRSFSSHGGLIPGLDYHAVTAPGTVPMSIAQYVKAAAYVNALIVADGPVIGAHGLSGVVSTGDEVRGWQNALNLSIKSGLLIDGDFGNKTAKATANFQKAYDVFAQAGNHPLINELGVVDPPTRAAMVKALQNLMNTIG